MPIIRASVLVQTSAASGLVVRQPIGCARDSIAVGRTFTFATSTRTEVGLRPALWRLPYGQKNESEVHAKLNAPDEMLTTASDEQTLVDSTILRPSEIALTIGTVALAHDSCARERERLG